MPDKVAMEDTQLSIATTQHKVVVIGKGYAMLNMERVMGKKAGVGVFDITLK